MGIAKRTAHATTATVAAIADSQDGEANLTGIPANYFENRAEQLDKAVDELREEEAGLKAEAEKQKAEIYAGLEREKRLLCAQLEQEAAAKAAEIEEEKESKVAHIVEEERQLAHQAEEFHHQAEMYSRNKRRCSYMDCLKGKASVPQERAGMLLFQALMIGGMVSIMASFNGYRHSGFDFFLEYHWMYPFIFCLTFLVREWFMNDFTGFIIRKFIAPNFEGFGKSTLITLTNILCMVPLMSTIVTCILYGVDDLGATLIDQVPITILVAALVNFFVVGPIVKMVYNNLIVANASGETGTYNRLRELIMPWLAAFNS